MEVMGYVFISDEETWHGYPKGSPHYQTYGESFEALQLKPQREHLGVNSSTFLSSYSNTTLLSWYWQRRILKFYTGW
jgi:hypothetical protein